MQLPENTDRDLVIGLSLGLANQPTGGCALYRLGQSSGVYEVSRLFRDDSTRYTAVIDRLTNMLDEQQALAEPRPVIAVDATRVGSPAVNLLRDSGLEPIIIRTDGVRQVEERDGICFLPRLDLVTLLQIAHQGS